MHLGCSPRIRLLELPVPPMRLGRQGKNGRVFGSARPVVVPGPNNSRPPIEHVGPADFPRLDGGRQLGVAHSRDEPRHNGIGGLCNITCKEMLNRGGQLTVHLQEFLYHLKEIPRPTYPTSSYHKFDMDNCNCFHRRAAAQALLTSGKRNDRQTLIMPC